MGEGALFGWKNFSGSRLPSFLLGLYCFFAPFCPYRNFAKTTENAFFFEGVVPRDDMHEAFRMTSGAQKRRHGRYTHGLGSPSVRGANRRVCAPERRTSPGVQILTGKIAAKVE